MYLNPKDEKKVCLVRVDIIKYMQRYRQTQSGSC